MKDFYAILGVSHAATESEIKKAFRKLAVQYHPDKNPLPEAKHLFQEINEAYDALSDRQKRALYDERRANPFAEILREPEQPRHRDPAYRRGRPAPPLKKEPPATFILMRDNLKYIMWVSRIGLLVSTLFFIDYFLPYRQIEEKIAEIYAVSVRNRVSYYIILTESGRKIKIYEHVGNFYGEPTVTSVVTRLYRTTISVSNFSGTYVAELAYMYGSLIFFPIFLFVNSLMAIVLKKRVELSFNLNVVGIVLLIINLVFI